MNSESLRQLATELINREKWADILQHFIDVLRINIFLLDTQGKVILPPCQDKYGGEFLTNMVLGLDLMNKPAEFLENFEQQGLYMEAHHQFDLNSFAIPVTAKDDLVIAYLIVGPVILNKKWQNEDYENLALKLNIDPSGLLDTVNEIRVVSYVTAKSILDLLAEVLKYGIQLNLQKKELNKMRLNKDVISKEVSEAAQDIYSSIYFDELLVTLLDVALSMTKTECGSIMIIDNEKGDLIIKVSRGIDNNRARNTRLKVGEGIAGLAVKDNAPFVISGTQGDNRIKHLLKRPDIKHALVMPLVSQNNVFGVLNLHTKKAENVLSETESLEIVSHLSKLASAAMHSIQQKNIPSQPTDS